MSEQWFVRREGQEEGPFTRDELFEMQRIGKLAAKDFVRVPGKSDWQNAVFIKGLFREGYSVLLDFTADQMKKVSANVLSDWLQDSAVTLTEIATEQGTSREDRRRALWMRGESQKLMAVNTDNLDEVIAIFQSAQRDFSQAVKSDPGWYAGKMLSKGGRWFPENPTFIPAYLARMSREPDHPNDQLAYLEAARALGNMGREAAELLPTLTLAASRDNAFGRHAVQGAIERITPSAHQQTSDETQMLYSRVTEELEAYAKHCVEAPRVEYNDEHPLTKEDVTRSESELVSLLGDKSWVIRVKSACILRCKVENPKPDTLRVLFKHLAADEKRGEVRGECALTLGHFSSNGSLKGGMHDKFVSDLLERLDQDTAYPVKAIAAELLVRFSNHLHDVIASLVSSLSNPQKSNLELALVASLGQCGTAAEKALPLVLRFTPHRDAPIGEIVKASTILRIAPLDHPDRRTSLNTVIRNLRWQPIAEKTTLPRHCREAAMKAIRSVPMDDLLRKKLLLERLFFDDSARLRCDAARALISLDTELATKAGAYLVIDRIRCS